MSLPSYVQPGDPLRTQWANDVAATLRGEQLLPTSKVTGKHQEPSPFDPIALWSEDGTNWKMKIQPGEFWKWRSTEPTRIRYNTAANYLDLFPIIDIVPNKDLYFNPRTWTLFWDDPTAYGNIKILKFVYDGADFKITNMYPDHIDFRFLPPFTPILARSGSTFSMAIIPGYVIERKPVQSGGALVVHTPSNMIVLNDLSYKTITNTQQISIVVKVNEFGEIDGSSPIVNCAVEAQSVDSTHYIPPVADMPGSAGTYHYKVAEFDGQKAIPYINGHIDHFQDITHLVNTVDPGADGMGRIIKEYKSSDDKYYLRVLKNKPTDPQVTVTEDTDHILIEGNGKVGEVQIIRCDSSPETLIEWEDGLVTTDGVASFHLPTYTAGTNIEITGESPCFTINCTCSGGSLSAEKIVNSDDVLKIATATPGEFELETVGLTADVLIKDCAEYPDEPPILLRMRFVNGLLKEVNEDVTSVPLLPIVHEVQLQSCHWIDDLVP